jgi:hypothetical protein
MPEADVQVRRATAEDAQDSGRICYEAFRAINEAHGFPGDFPHPEMAVGLLSMLFADPGFHCLVAELDGRIIGSNCLVCARRSPDSAPSPSIRSCRIAAPAAS